ncbi:hypothetical protein E3J84_00595 [Candidatus Aerophobetes bacterium]|uniref:WxL domain-containing protein n=1 Tax=Aerophobetes bacterium TaxID=2030807 RepID=A0A523S4R0_UNCAE|nr:MAG: hypothetical protein E3J84_00595 [Candidatus Aerophobetes bacterium]
MKKLLGVFLAAALTLGLASIAMAATDSGTGDVTITLEEIAQLDVVGGSISFTFANTGTTAGSLPTVSDDTATSLSWTSNVSANSRKITAQLSADYTTGIVLKATVTVAGGNGTTGGIQTLVLASAKDMVTGITNENVTGNTVTYNATLSNMIAPVTNESKTVTWTLLAAAA